MTAEDQHQSYSPYTVDLTQELNPRPPPRTPRAPGTARRSPRGVSGKQSVNGRRRVRSEPKTNKVLYFYKICMHFSNFLGGFWWWWGKGILIHFRNQSTSFMKSHLVKK